MTLYCALDDFMKRTLAAVPGAWGKLRYIRTLRRPGGRYEHWGMSRIYGEAAAISAIEEAHRAVLLEVLRTPVRDLLADAESSAAAAQLPVNAFLQELSANVPALLPGHMGGGSARHFSSVLQALSCLSRAGRVASRQVS